MRRNPLWGRNYIVHTIYTYTIKKRVVLGSWKLLAGASEAARSTKNITAAAAASAVANKAAKAATNSTRNSQVRVE